MTAAPSVPVPRVVEASDVERVLVSACAEAVRGVGSFVVVQGGLGVGKSWVLREVARRATIPVGFGATVPGGAVSGTWPWQRALAMLGHDPAWRDAMEAVGAEFAAASAAGAMAIESIETVAEVLAETARSRPFLLALDDVDSHGGASWELLRAVGARAPASGMVVVATCRSLAGGRIEETPPTSAVTMLQLQGVSEAELARIVCSIAGDDAAAIERVTRIAAGNPLVATELAHMVADPTRDPSPELRALLRDRIRALPRAGVCALIALAGRRVPADLVGRVLALDPPGLDGEIGMALADHVIVSGEGRPRTFELSHPAVAGLLLARLTPGDRSSLHGELARALDQKPGWAADPSEAARHALRSGRTGTAVGRLLGRAARALETTGDLEGAATLVDHGLAIVPSGDERIELLRSSGRLAARSGDRDQASRVLTRALEAASAVEDHRRMADILLEYSGVRPEIFAPDARWREVGFRCVENLRTTDPALGARLLSHLAHSTYADEPAVGLRLGRQAVELSIESGDQAAQEFSLRQLTPLVTHTPGGGDLVMIRDELRRLRGGDGPFEATNAEAQIILQCGTVDELRDWLRRRRALGPQHQSAAELAEEWVMTACLATLELDVDGYARASERVMELCSPDIPWPAILLVTLHRDWHLNTGRAAPVDLSGLERLLLAAGLGALTSLGAETVSALLGDPEAITRLEPLVHDPRSVEGQVAWILQVSLLTLAASLTGRRDVAAHGVELLEPYASEWVTVGPFAVFGPVGFFLSAALRSLDDPRAGEAAVAGLAAARRLGSAAWIVRCGVLCLTIPGAVTKRVADDLRREVGELIEANHLQLHPHEQVVLQLVRPGHPERSEQVMRLASEGRSNREISRELGISVTSVERALTAVFRASGVTNRAAAISFFAGRHQRRPTDDGGEPDD